MRGSGRRVGIRLALALLALLAAAPAAAQELLQRALDLEERGRWTDAAAAYTELLRQSPADAPSLIGLERVGTQLGWRDSVLAYARRAIAADSLSATARGVELRTLLAMGEDSLAAAALLRWTRADPRSQQPYREWAQLALQAGRVGQAREAVTMARTRLGNPSALAPELARVEVAEGDWAHAAAEWRAAVTAMPAYDEAAAFSLRPAPVAARQSLLNTLVASGPGVRESRRVAATLLLGWNEPGQAWALLRQVLPEGSAQRLPVLRSFADRARALDGPGAQRAAAQAYEAAAAIADRDEAVRLEVESARAYAAAGDGASARRLLAALAGDPSAGAQTRSSAAAAMIELAVRQGSPGDAERMLAAAGGGTISESDRAALRLAIARGWLGAGNLDGAERAVAGDSSLGADEVRGWVALYRGNLGEARRLLRSVGAAFGDRAAAPRRAATVALLDEIGRDTLPALGEALLLAARGDSLGASRGLVTIARTISGDAVPDLLAWAARDAAARDAGTAEALWREIVERYPAAGCAPAAALALARALAARGDLRGAAAQLEAMILAHPESALVPEARRELDRVRGLVPGT